MLQLVFLSCFFGDSMKRHGSHSRGHSSELFNYIGNESNHSKDTTPPNGDVSTKYGRKGHYKILHRYQLIGTRFHTITKYSIAYVTTLCQYLDCMLQHNGILTLIAFIYSIAFLFLCHENYISCSTYRYMVWDGDDAYPWVSFGAYVGIPRFYTTKGALKHNATSHLSLATICDIDSIGDAKAMASNYGGGPVSLAIYIDRDYREHSNKEADRLKALFDDEFKDIGNKYELIIGILYLNRSDEFW